MQIGLLLGVFLSSLVVVARARPYYFPLYNALDVRLTVVLVLLLLLGGASHAERNTAGASDTVVFVGVVLVLIVFAAVAVHAVGLDVWQIVRGRKNVYSAEAERRERLVAVLAKEKADLDPAVSPAVALFMAQLMEKGEGAADGLMLQPIEEPVAGRADSSSSSSSSSSGSFSSS